MKYNISFIQCLEQDFGMMLLTQESEKTDYIETAGGSTADTISYFVKPVTVTTESVTGIIYNHPHGATITASFNEPVEAYSATVDVFGDELDFQDNSGALARAILAKLGNISLPDSELKAYAARA